MISEQPKTQIDTILYPDYFSNSTCTGCGCCVSICPYHALSMHPCPDGVERPLVDLTKCLHCNRCIDACEIYKCYA